MAVKISEAGITAMAKAHHDYMRDYAETFLGEQIKWEALNTESKQVREEAMRKALEAL